MKHTKKLIVQAIKVLLSAGIIYWLVQSGKLNFVALKNLLAPGPAALGLSLILLNLFLGSERWRLLIQTQGLIAAPYPIMKLSLIGTFFNFAMPGGVGGDVVKAYYFSRENPGSKVIAVTSVLMDRVLGLFAMILLALLVMLYDFSHIIKTPVLYTLFWFIAVLFFVFALTLTLVFSQKDAIRKSLHRLINVLPLAERLRKLYESMHLYGHRKSRLCQVIALSLVAQLCSICFLYLAGHMAGFEGVSAKIFLIVAPLGFMATAIPISPAGVGVGQAAFYFLFNIYTGTPSDVGPTCITAFQVGTFLISLLGAFFYLRRKDRRDNNQMQETLI